LSGLVNENPDLIVDALIGYSLRSAPRGAVLQMINWANGRGSPILSLDIPSGIDSTTGEAPGEYVSASRTMTLALPKRGLKPGTTGDLFLADIGIPSAVYERLGLSYISPFGNLYVIPLHYK
jgi:NAD(P)H-hydrate epimerase